MPPRNAAGHFRLPVDRVFSVKGFGTVVTGTLISGAQEKNGKWRRFLAGGCASAALRSTAIKQAAPLPASALRSILQASTPPISHGATCFQNPRVFVPAARWIAARGLLRSSKPLKHRAPVHFHSGTAEIEAEVRLFGSTILKPGDMAYARLVLRQAALLLPGRPLHYSQSYPVSTIGGGVVIDAGARRYRKSDDIGARLDALSSPDAAVRVALLVSESRYGAPRRIAARTGLIEREIAAAASKAALTVVAQPDPWYIDPAWFQAARVHLIQAVRDFHRANPLQPGIPRQDLRGAVLPDSPPFLLDALLAVAKEIAIEGEIARLRTHRVALKADEEQARAAIERAFETAGLAVPALNEVLAQSGVEAARARTLLQQLLREQKLVRVGPDLVFHQSAIASLRQLLAARKAERFNVGAFKEWTGISRKYAIPLLEFLDREHVTRRDGDDRIVLGSLQFD